MAQLTPTATASKTATTATTCYLLPPDAFATGYSYWLPLLLLLLFVQTGTSATQSYINMIQGCFCSSWNVIGLVLFLSTKYWTKNLQWFQNNHPAEVVKNFTKLHLLYFWYLAQIYMARSSQICSWLGWVVANSMVRASPRRIYHGFCFSTDLSPLSVDYSIGGNGEMANSEAQFCPSVCVTSKGRSYIET